MAGAHTAGSQRSRLAIALLSLAGLLTAFGVGLVIWTFAGAGDDTATPGTYVSPSAIAKSVASEEAAVSPAASPTVSPTPTPTRSGSASASGSSASGSSGSGSQGRAPAGDPARVIVTSSSGKELVNANLQRTLLDSKGVLAPPPGIAGWYSEPGWPKPGDKGASILVGHINYRGGPDVFWNLTSARPGDVVTVTYGNGRSVKFQVTKSKALSKKAVPQDTTIWDWQNPSPLLRLITCDPTTPLNGGHYEGNWVVWATPLA